VRPIVGRSGRHCHALDRRCLGRDELLRRVRLLEIRQRLALIRRGRAGEEPRQQ
jgi:hypothetical protein